MILKKEYFSAPATFLAPDLLGKLLCRRTKEGIIRSRITETECYFGENDTACHAHKGKTRRNLAMYEAGGVAYVYLCYGIHSMLNIVTGKENHPEAVLIRGLSDAKGPGRTTVFMKITTSDNLCPLTEDGGIWVEDDGSPAPRYSALPRIGIDYADEEDRLRPWRFLIK